MRKIIIDKSEIARLQFERGMAFVGGDYTYSIELGNGQANIGMRMVPDTNKHSAVQASVYIFRPTWKQEYAWEICTKDGLEFVSNGYTDFFDCHQASLLYLLEIQRNGRSELH